MPAIWFFWIRGESVLIALSFCCLFVGCVPSVETGIKNQDVDFGIRFRPSMTINHDFEIENSSSNPINLSLVGTSCSCTIGEFTDGIMQPSGKRELSVKWDVPNYPGRHSFEVVLASSDGQRFRFTGQVRVRDVVSLDPLSISFDDLLPAERQTKSVIVRLPRDESRFAFSELALLPLGDTLLDAKIRRMDSFTYRIDVSATGSGVNQVRRGVIEIETGSARQNILSVPYSIKDSASVICSPSAIIVYANPQQTLELRSANSKPFSISEVRFVGLEARAEMLDGPGMIVGVLFTSLEKSSGSILFNGLCEGEAFRLEVPVLINP